MVDGLGPAFCALLFGGVFGGIMSDLAWRAVLKAKASDLSPLHAGKHYYQVRFVHGNGVPIKPERVNRDGKSREISKYFG